MAEENKDKLMFYLSVITSVLTNAVVIATLFTMLKILKA